MKNNWYYKFLIVFIILFSMFFFLNDKLSNIINNSSIKNITINIAKQFNGKKANDKELINLKKEVDNYELESLKKELEILKETMNIEKTYTSNKVIYAKTIIRNKMYWFNTITIDKGKKDGIEEGDAVVGKNSLIGIVIRTTKDNSQVKLITNNDNKNKISITIKSENETITGLIEGYEYPYIKASVESEVKNGDEVITSGLGNLPKNINIGKVEKIEKDSLDLINILYIKPLQDINDINYVGVLKVTWFIV